MQCCGARIGLAAAEIRHLLNVKITKDGRMSASKSSSFIRQVVHVVFY